jgi:putative membrane protein
MRTWMKVLSLAVVLAVGGGLRADDDKKRTGDKPTRTDDRRGDDRRDDDRRTDERRTDDKKFSDTHFVDHAYTGGQNEVLLNRMALQRTQNEDVRKFAQKMLEDHGKANQDLLLIVSEARIAVPDKPLPEQEKDLRHISSNEVKNFDKEYMDHMVMNHEKSVKLFEQGSKELKNEKLKEFATKTLPVIKEHLKMAKETRDKVAKGNRDGDRGGERNNRDNK